MREGSFLSRHLDMYLSFSQNDKQEEEDIHSRMKDILCSGKQHCNNGPGEVLDHLYLGNWNDAHDYRWLKRRGITHVVNMAGRRGYEKNLVGGSPYDPKESGVKHYMEFMANDNEEYPILLHFDKIRHFLDCARDTGGRALIHCELGMNRSAAPAVAYLCVTRRITLLQALREVHMVRPAILTNEGFRRQLIRFARENNLLTKKKET